MDGDFDMCPSTDLASSQQANSGHSVDALRQAQDTKFRLRRNLVEAAGVEPASENWLIRRPPIYFFSYSTSKPEGNSKSDMLFSASVNNAFGNMRSSDALNLYCGKYFTIRLATAIA